MKAWRAFLSVSLVFFAPFRASADLPLREEQFIYSVLAFNGVDYSDTFVQKNEETLFLLADVHNFLAARNCFVYYWPPTKEWKVDTSVLNIPFEGTLEINGGRMKTPAILAAVRFTYYNMQGRYEQNWIVARGEEANRAWNHYQEIITTYYHRLQQFQNERANYDALFSTLSSRIAQLREQGKDVSSLVEAFRRMIPPRAPELPRDFVVPPRPIAEAFVLNLPEGQYAIRFFSPDGSVMEGSERKVIVFQARRRDGIGLEIIPETNWTRAVQSKTPSTVMYIDGSADIYVRPFLEQEYNDLYFENMKRNGARGNPDVVKWVRTNQVPDCQIELLRSSGKAEIVVEKPFLMEKSRAPSTGYRIVPLDPADARNKQEASLQAFHIPIDRQAKRMRIRIRNVDGRTLPHGEREIRVIVPSHADGLMLILALLPLPTMVAVMIRRSHKLKNRSH